MVGPTGKISDSGTVLLLLTANDELGNKQLFGLNCWLYWAGELVFWPFC